MLGGFNTNVPYKGKIYHVQTEDGGTKNPILTTQVYFQGAILASERSNYAELLIDDDWKDRVLKKMKEQHKKFINDLVSGKLTGDAHAKDEEKTRKGKKIDEIILEYILPG